MATRNLTSKFDSIRSQLHSGTKRPRDYDGGKNALLADDSASDAVESGRGLGLGTDQEMPPEWVDITDAIHADTNKVKESSQSNTQQRHKRTAVRQHRPLSLAVCGCVLCQSARCKSCTPLV